MHSRYAAPGWLGTAVRKTGRRIPGDRADVDATIDVGSITSIDPFIDAIYAAEGQEGSITSWLMKPATAQAIRKLKKLSSGSNESLLSFTESGDLSSCGRPVAVTPHVDANTLALGISQEHNVLVSALILVAGSPTAAFTVPSVCRCRKISPIIYSQSTANCRALVSRC